MLYFIWVIKMTNSMITAERLKQCRLKANQTLEQIGTLVGVHKTTVMRWEKGETERIGLPTIQILSAYYNVSPAWLMGADVPMEENLSVLPDNIIPLPKTKMVPLVGTIACGTPILAEENIESMVSMPEHIHADFALRCKGNSMVGARILDNDIVYIRKQETVENGEIAAVLIDNEATLKRFYRYGDTVVLRAENPTFKEIEYRNEELNDLKILGKAVYFLSKVN